MPECLVCPNGINGLTGEYLLSPLKPAQLVARLKEPLDEGPRLARELRQLGEAVYQPSWAPYYVCLEDFSDTGWAIVFCSDEADDIKNALTPLIEHRRRLIEHSRRRGDTGLRTGPGHSPEVKVLDYLPGEQWPHWLHRHGTTPGNMDLRKVPYYVLLVGSPTSIPFDFQYRLGVEYAVGRLHFDDTVGYQRYVAALVDYEKASATPHDQAAVFFGTRHPFDDATQLSADLLVRPLAETFRPGGLLAARVGGYQINPPILGPSATKSALGEILAGGGLVGRPALLFSATHGLGGWPPGHPDQTSRHGALLCQDWPGLGQISPASYFAAADVAPDARIHGLVAYFFACYGAGTPEKDSFLYNPGEPPLTIAAEPFVAALPKRLLEGGALAVIGHVDRTWGYSFRFGREPQLEPFQNAIGRILEGEPVGHAMKDFNHKYAVLTQSLYDQSDEMRSGGKLIEDAELARLWTERKDAQNYIVLGDPAAALRIV